MNIWKWVIVLVVVALIFGTKKLRNIGQDLGAAMKGFKDGLKAGSQGEEAETEPAPKQLVSRDSGDIVDVDVVVKDGSGADKAR